MRQHKAQVLSLLASLVQILEAQVLSLLAVSRKEKERNLLALLLYSVHLLYYCTWSMRLAELPWQREAQKYSL